MAVCTAVPVRAARALASAALLALSAVALLVAVAQPAEAHTRAQSSSNYESTIVAAPELDGVTWRTYAGGDLIEVVNTGPADLVVLGYEGEPYLRVGPDGVFENRNSPATYLNADRDADVAVPPRADATAAPEWSRVSAHPGRAWHDHRVHWMAPTPPPAVATATGRDIHIGGWALPFVVDGQPFELAGQLRWVAPPAWWAWLLGALLLTVPAAAGLRRGRGRPRPRLLRPAAAVVGAVALLNSIHFVDELLAWPAPTLDVLFGVFHTALFVGVGLVGACLAWRGRTAPVAALGIGSAAVAFHQGLLQLPILTSSQLPTIWPAWLLRLAVASSIAQAVWVALVVTVAVAADPQAGEVVKRDALEGVDRNVCGTDAAHKSKELI